MRASGQTWTAITNALNGAGFRTRRGKAFQPVQVQCMLALLTLWTVSIPIFQQSFVAGYIHSCIRLFQGNTKLIS